MIFTKKLKLLKNKKIKYITMSSNNDSVMMAIMVVKR